jgi:nicotinamidase/pyrazinamidase
MTFPNFYQPDRVGTLFVPDTLAATTAGQVANLSPAAEDTTRTLLLLVDAQVDFIHEDGALSVPGAVADTRRTIEWLFTNMAQITAIAGSLDSHVPIQIFYPTWWADEQGQHPAPYTPISSADIAAGRWHPLIVPEWSVNYVQQLETQAKKVLMIWPYHTMIGTPGQAITPALYEAIAYHAAARKAQPIFLSKGTLAKTEHYSALEPEVKIPEAPDGGLNTAFLHQIASYDRIYIAGQAKSHCVLETLASIMRYYADQPDTIGKFHLLTDCTSSVAHPEIDFEALAVETLAAFQAQGLKLVTSTTPLA